jgi:hypothetical protein
MTRHISEDTLLELALGLSDARSERSVRKHLEECLKCRALLKDVEQTVNRIKDVTPVVAADLPVLPSLRHGRHAWLRVAAMLAIGFGLGFLASESLHSPSVVVVRQQLVSKPPELSTTGFVACDEVDLSRNLH